MGDVIKLPVRRVAPPDRRSPRPVTAGSCPMGDSCYCCPLGGERWHSRSNSQRTCERRHPGEDRMCSPGYPKHVNRCPENEASNPSEVPAGPRTTRPYACCIECGRITAHRWTDPQDGKLLPWCAGD